MLFVSFVESVNGGKSKLEKERKEQRKSKRKRKSKERKENSKKKNHEKFVCGFEIYCVVGLW